MQKQMILTSERHVEHPLAGPNTTINRRKTLEKENEEERPIVRTLYITVIAFTTQQVFWNSKKSNTQIFKYLNT